MMTQDVALARPGGSVDHVNHLDPFGPRYRTRGLDRLMQTHGGPVAAHGSGCLKSARSSREDDLDCRLTRRILLQPAQDCQGLARAFRERIMRLQSAYLGHNGPPSKQNGSRVRGFISPILRKPVLATLTLLPLLTGGSTPGRTATENEIGAFAYRQQPGSELPLGATARDQAGRQATIGTLLDGKPAILALVYYRCPNICGVVLSDLFQALGRAGLVAERDYTLLALSIDPAETQSDAGTARARDVAAFPLPGAADGWHYLTADAPTIATVADAVGFRSRFDPALKQFLHPAGLVFVTPNGRVSGYLLGVGYKAGDVRLGLVAAGENTLQKAALPIVLLCFHFDPQTGRYTLAVLRLLQIAGGITVLTIGGALWLAFRRERMAPP